MKATLSKVIQLFSVASVFAGIITSCHTPPKYPCPSIPYEQYQKCGCDPNVRFAIDILAGTNLSDETKASIVSCITSTIDVKIKDTSAIKSDISGCVSKHVTLNNEIIKVISDIATKASSDKKPVSTNDICDWKKCIYGSNVTCDKTEITDSPKLDDYGLKFNKIVWKHFYLPNANYRGEIEYNLVNASNISIVILPPFQGSWFGKNIKTPKITSKIFGEDRYAYSIEQEHFSHKEETRTDINGQNMEVTTYLWQFNIKPALDPQKTLHYAIILETDGTEHNAFTSEGSFAGMWSPFAVTELGCELIAPDGFKFKKETYFVRDRTGRMLQVAGLSKPEYSEDDKKISWIVQKPIPHAQYLIKVVIVKAN